MIRWLLFFTLLNLVCSLPISIYVARRGRRMQNFPHITPAYIYGRENNVPISMYSSKFPRPLSLLELLIRPARYISQNSKKSVRRSRNLKFRDDYNFNAIENFDPYRYKSNSLFSGKSTKVFKSPLSFIKLKRMSPKKESTKVFRHNIYEPSRFIQMKLDKERKQKKEIIIQPDILRRIDSPFSPEGRIYDYSLNDKESTKTVSIKLDQNEHNKPDTTKNTNTSADEKVTEFRLNVFEPSNSISLTFNKNQNKNDINIQSDQSKIIDTPIQLDQPKTNDSSIQPDEPKTMDTSADEQRNDFLMHVYAPPKSTELDKIQQKKSDILIRPANVVFQRKGQIVQSRRSKLLKFNFYPPVEKDEKSTKAIST